MEEDMMLAAKKLAPILISVALLAVGLTANSGAARADSPGPGGTPPARATVAVDTGTSLGVIPPVAFGLNASAYDGALLDPAVPGLVRAAGVGIMRYPGGAEADVYHWQDNTITPITPGNLGGYANPNDTYDNFMKVASGAGAQAMLTVNYGSNISGTAGGDPQEAAAWVRDANVVKHYGVTYWEIGNEVYGNGTYGPYFETDLHPDKGPAAYANHALEYIAAMKAVDPSIKIGAVLTAPGNYPDGQTSSLSPQPWNDTVLPILCPAVDFVDVHWYPQDPASQSNNPLPESDARLLQSPAQGNGTRTPSIPAMVATLRAKIAQYCPSRAAQIQIMITETNSVSYNPGKQTVSLVNALFLDDNYMTWLEHGVTNVDWFQLHNSPMTGANINTSPSLYGTATYGDYGILSYGQSPEPAADTPFPPYYGLQMLTNLGRPGDQMVASSSDTAMITAHAVKRADGSLAVLLINKDPAASYDVALSLSGYTPDLTRTVYSYGMNSAAISSTTDASSANITVGPYSLTTLVLKPSSSPGGGPAATPELGSGELLALGFVPVLLLALRRKRRKA